MNTYCFCFWTCHCRSCGKTHRVNVIWMCAFSIFKFFFSTWALSVFLLRDILLLYLCWWHFTLLKWIYLKRDFFFFKNICVLSCFSHVWLLATLWTVAHQAPLSMGILQARILEWLPCPPPGDLPRNWTCVSYVSCFGRRVLYHWNTTW